MSKLIPLALFGAGAALAAKYLKDNKTSPSAAAKRASNLVKLTYPVNSLYDNGVAQTPPMGWSSWNLFRNKIDENLIYEMGVALKESGLLDCGYQYLNIDDCWHSSMRDKDGKLQGDLVTFPSGIKSLVERVNALGLKLGIYTSNGTLTCEDLPASLGYEEIDADTFAEWGIEYFKYDFCHNIPISSSAPNIEKITISSDGSSECIEYKADDAILSGEAMIVADASLPDGKYISGLSANAGSCEWLNVYAEQEGEYNLTLCLRKMTNKDKYIEILVNGDRRYKTTVPATKSFTPEGRHQIKIYLNKGTNTLKLYNPVASRIDSAAIQYTDMGKELKRATKDYAEKNGVPEKPIVYSICEWGWRQPWKWGRQAGNLWRTTPDIRPVWNSVLGIYERNVLLYKYAGVGGWNDPDMLEVGNGNLTAEENKSHFTLWCMMASPLILGNDIRAFIREDGTVDKDNETYKILSNKELIAIDQDKLGMQCRRIKTNGIEDILVKPLENGEFAICFFNKASIPTVMQHGIKDIVFRPFVSTMYSKSYIIKDLWSGEEEAVDDKISAMVPAHGVRIFRVKVNESV